MPTINSSLSNKSYQGGLKEYVVSDESQPSIPQEEIVNPYARNAQPAMTSMHNHNAIKESLEDEKRILNRMDSRISPAAKKRIEMLCGMSSIERQVDIEGNIFILRSIKSKDNRQALSAAIKFDGTVEFSFELRKQILARSLISIAGADIDAFLGTNDFDIKLEFLEELDEAILDRLYNEYLLLSKEIKEKYSISKEEEVKEVVDELKK